MIVPKEQHICLNCRFFCKGAHYDCRENIDELVKDKDRPNFCEYFSLDKTKLEENEQKRSANESSGKVSAEDVFNKFFDV